MTGYDPFDDEVKRDPFEYYREFNGTCPVNHYVYPDVDQDWVSRNPMVSRPTPDFYQIFSHADVVHVLQNPQIFSSKQGTGPERADPPDGIGMLIFADPPHHTLQRRIVNKALTPRLVALMEPFIRSSAEELVDRFVDRGRVDIAREYTVNLPPRVFAHVLGVPQSEVATFKRWADAIIASFGGTEETYAAAVTAMDELAAYFAALIAERRKGLEAGETPPDDLLTALIVSDYEGRQFDDGEIILALYILVAGGNETTGSALVNAVYQLCQHPDQLAKLRADRSLLPVVGEETLRYESSPPCQFRTNNVEVELSGVTIPADSKIAMMYGAANRDPKVFSNPEEFDITRDIREIRQHLGFGRGIHACVGMALARAQMRIGLEVLLDRLPDFEIDESETPVQQNSVLVRNFSSLWIKWTPPGE